MKPRPLFLIGAMLLASGCAYSTNIMKPANGSMQTNPVTFEVLLDNAAAPGSFSARLDGTDITASFTPQPAAGATVTAMVPNVGFGTHTFSTSATLLAHSPWTVNVEEAQVSFTVPVPPPLPALQMFDSTGTRLTPPHPTSRNIPVNIRVTVEPGVTLPAAVTVTITARTQALTVQLNGNPVGVGIQVTLQPNSPFVDFNVTSAFVGQYVVDAAAPGFQPAMAQGSVVP